jgi:hypothetical protein
MSRKWVRDTDLKLAHTRWLEAWPIPHLCDWSRFCNEASFPESNDYSGNGTMLEWFISEEGAHRIRLIVESPHWRTLLKVWAVQYADGIFK